MRRLLSILGKILLAAVVAVASFHAGGLHARHVVETSRTYVISNPGLFLPVEEATLEVWRETGGALSPR